jgi:hypothetical protein
VCPRTECPAESWIQSQRVRSGVCARAYTVTELQVCVCHAPHQADGAEYPRTEPPKKVNNRESVGSAGLALVRMCCATRRGRGRVLYKLKTNRCPSSYSRALTNAIPTHRVGRRRTQDALVVGQHVQCTCQLTLHTNRRNFATRGERVHPLLPAVAVFVGRQGGTPK